MSSSWFEIGGLIVESHIPGDGTAEPPRIFRRSWPEVTRIQSSYGLMDDKNPQGLKVSKGPAAQGAAGGEQDEYLRQTLGSMLVRTGAVGLMIPDPIPLVDEIVFAGMIGVGVALHSSTW